MCVGACLCLGLALSNQHTSVLLILPLATCVVWDAGHLQHTTTAALHTTLKLGVVGAMGLVPYTYLYTSARGLLDGTGTVTVGSWGDAGTLDGLWTHLSRAEYGSLSLSPVVSPSSTTGTRLRVRTS